MASDQALPVIINNRDRKTSLERLIGWLEKLPTKIAIIIVDNASTYPPLLEYYESLRGRLEVVRLSENLGPFAPWVSGAVEGCDARDGYFVVTDSDVVPMDECPLSVLEIFMRVLDGAPQVNKVGHSLNIFDLPDHFAHKWEVIAWELQWWREPVDKLLYRAAIDTTFAMYRKGISVAYDYDHRLVREHAGWDFRPEGFLKAVRTGFPYMARHLPWYVDSARPGDEEVYVRAHSEIPTHWTTK